MMDANQYHRLPGRAGANTRLKSLPTLLITLAMCLTVAILPAAEGRTVRVGVYDNAPKIFIAESGRPAGIFVDILNAVARNEGWRIEYVPGTWDEGLQRLEDGKIDLMPDMAYSSEREKTMSFHSVPVLSSWSQVYARRGSNIKSMLDLNGLRIAVLQGSVQQTALEGLARGFGMQLKLVPYANYEEAFAAVLNREVDAVVTNNYYGLLHGRKLGLENTAVVFNPSTLFFAARKGMHADLLAAIDDNLRSMKAKPESAYYQALRKWTSENVKLLVPMWLKLLGLVIGIALIVSVAEAFALKVQVARRTQELQESNRQMEARVIERTAELAAAMEQAQEADRIKSAFLATMSHELRTPLNSIIGFTGILLQELPGELNEEQHKQLSMVQKSARHLLSLINDVLDISKIEAGQLDIAVQPFSLRSSLEKVANLVAPLAEKKGLELRVDIAGDIGNIVSDQRRLEQIVLNLLSNAVKFTEEGMIHLDCRMEDARVAIRVQDTGIGMEQQDLEKVFEPFSQIDTGLTRKYEGTGLGLSICKRLVELMGGDISVTRTPGQGSMFMLLLPLHQGEW